MRVPPVTGACLQGGVVRPCTPHLLGVLHHTLFLLAEPLHAQAHHVARFEEQRRLMPQSDPGRGSRGDDIARRKRHEPAQVGDDRRDPEDHGARIAGLAALAVDRQPEIECLRIRHLVGGHQPWAAGREGVVAFPFRPLPIHFDLIGAFRDVVQHAIARDVAQRLRFGHMPAGPADDERQLHFPIQLLGTWRQDDRIIGAAERAGVLVEHDRLRRDRRVRFSCVIGVVQSDANDAAHVADARTQPYRPRDLRQAPRIERAKPVETVRHERRAVDVPHDAGQVPQQPLRIQDTRALLSPLAVSDQAHSATPPLRVGLRSSRARRIRSATGHPTGPRARRHRNR